MSSETWRDLRIALFHPAVMVGALGYFVDVYDLILFTVVRTNSLRELGVSEHDLTGQGAYLLNMQMAGMLLGGILGGMLGDFQGRIKLLFGSIVLYSVANIANGFVHSIPEYALWRFLAGLGLAGELGGSVTLVAEALPQRFRGYGTMLVTGIGVLGAVAAGSVGLIVKDWRIAYFLGGGLGLALFLLRINVKESTLFHDLKQSRSLRIWDQLKILSRPRFLQPYLCCILVGLPTWYVLGLIILNCPQLTSAMGMSKEMALTNGTGVILVYLGISCGDLLSGSISQYLQSRKKVLALFIGAMFLLTNIFFALKSPPFWVVAAVILLLGISVGYWAIFVTIAAEHVGTNIRATVTTTVPNFTRAMVIPITSSYSWLTYNHYTSLFSGLLIGWVVVFLAVLGIFGLRETFHEHLDYLEED